MLDRGHYGPRRRTGPRCRRFGARRQDKLRFPLDVLPVSRYSGSQSTHAGGGYVARPPLSEDQLGLLQGTLDMLILQTLRQGRDHHRADLQRRAAGGPRIALPGAPPAAQARLDRRYVGRLDQQSAGEVLRAHRDGPPAARPGGDEVGADGRGGGARHAAGGSEGVNEVAR